MFEGRVLCHSFKVNENIIVLIDRGIRESVPEVDMDAVAEIETPKKCKFR